MLEENTSKVTNYEQLKSKLEKGGLFYAPWCGKEVCEEKIKEETGADIRVIPFDSKNEDAKCVYCKEKSVVVPIFARGY